MLNLDSLLFLKTNFLSDITKKISDEKAIMRNSRFHSKKHSFATYCRTFFSSLIRHLNHFHQFCVNSLKFYRFLSKMELDSLFALFLNFFLGLHKQLFYTVLYSFAYYLSSSFEVHSLRTTSKIKTQFLIGKKTHGESHFTATSAIWHASRAMPMLCRPSRLDNKLSQVNILSQTNFNVSVGALFHGGFFF